MSLKLPKFSGPLETSVTVLFWKSTLLKTLLEFGVIIRPECSDHKSVMPLVHMNILYVSILVDHM